LITGAVVMTGESMARAHGVLGLLGAGFFFLVSKPLQWGFYYLCLRAVRGRSVAPEHLALVRANYREVVIAGFLVTLGVLLGVTVSPWWLGLAAFVGCGLMFAGASGWCGMAILLGRMPWNRGASGPSCGI